MIEQILLDMLLEEAAQGTLHVAGRNTRDAAQDTLPLSRWNDPFVPGHCVRVLSLTQPWATLVVITAKRLETRSWRVPYRGPIAIHASTNFPRAARILCDTEPFRTALLLALAENKPGRFLASGAAPQGRGWSALLPTGVILGRCNLNGCEPITGDNLPPEPERSFGIYTCPGRYAWHLSDVQEFSRPILAKGSLGLWRFTWPDLA